MRRAYLLCLPALLLAGCGSVTDGIPSPAGSAPVEDEGATQAPEQSEEAEPTQEPDEAAAQEIFDDYSPLLGDPSSACAADETSFAVCYLPLSNLINSMEGATGDLAQAVDDAERKYPEVFGPVDAANEALDNFSAQGCSVLFDAPPGDQALLCSLNVTTITVSADTVLVAIGNIAEGD